MHYICISGLRVAVIIVSHGRMLMYYICISELRDFRQDVFAEAPGEMYYICISELRVKYLYPALNISGMHYICTSEELRYGTGQTSKNSVNMHCMYKCELSYL